MVRPSYAGSAIHLAKWLWSKNSTLALHFVQHFGHIISDASCHSLSMCVVGKKTDVVYLLFKDCSMMFVVNALLSV